mmetsp:Transcript_4420/g.16889  ORF Transcript_4420/g.16889 Transcript_4420/m.16889 type:complete len:205 (-) Transcript_4420:324-938(-)
MTAAFSSLETAPSALREISSSASATPICRGFGAVYDIKLCADLIGSTRRFGPTAQPTRQPVKFKSLLAEPIVTVRALMSPTVARRVNARPPNTDRSYTSSLNTVKSKSSASAAMPKSSSCVITCPVGLCGEHMTSNAVRSREHAARTASTSTRNPSSARARTTTETAPTSSAMALYHGKNGSTKTISRLDVPSPPPRVAAWNAP